MLKLPKVQVSRHQILNLFFSDQSGKMLEGSVPGFFGIGGKAAAGQLSAFKMVADALTAKSLATAWIIAAVAGREVFFFLTLHRRFLS
jgi:hypothetical protein